MMIVENRSDDVDFVASPELQRIVEAVDTVIRTSAAWVLQLEGEQSLNHLLKSCERSISDLADGESIETRDTIAAGR